MTATEQTLGADSALRQRAQGVAHDTAASAPDPSEEASPDAMRQLIQELRVHQIELEMQNEELRRTQAERDAAQARYFDFYDLAPVGYLTVSEAGLILDSNLMAAALLGVARSGLARRAFSRFMAREDQAAYELMRQQLLQTGRSQSCEMRLRKPDGSHFFARIDAIAVSMAPGAPVLRLVLLDITAKRQADENLRIAAVAFEAHEAMAVMDAQRQVLRVNQAFTEITGYSLPDVRGQTTRHLRSTQHDGSFYESLWRDTVHRGSQRVACWLKRKNGEDFFAEGSTTAVKDLLGQTTHYVVTFSDQTLKQQHNQQRVQQEAAHRDALVREVHHRIKNNLQGVGGLLQQFASQKPEIAQQMQLVAGHLKGISFIHGLLGRQDPSRVRLCELTREIAQTTSVIWHTDIGVDIPPEWVFRVVAEKEAVSMALVLNELLCNAVKHGGQAQGHVSVTLRQGPSLEGVALCIVNAGTLHPNPERPHVPRHGLQLIESLRPRDGFSLALAQCGEQVQTLLQLSAPVLTLDT